MKTSEMKSTLEDQHVFSLEGVKKIGKNDDAFTRQILIRFAYQVSMCTGGIKDAIQNNDWSKLKSIIHKNIPAYSIMNATEALELLKSIETNADNLNEQGRVRKWAEMVCEKNDGILTIVIDYLQLLKRTRDKNPYKFNEPGI